ncbi:PREDICTED: DNA polymerase alpha catalytic subunit-like [Priapulus caudatus]|uniref:DNA polymerase alpha catalytic subunit-like n=1 Tax=Priapulus caudatus TaxID=37621 RepID=A0ABM1EAQ4_PRICU|nr:PREDICTED: DNA polymerase alpha catalytic subunit-like [Priapulus caudatus]
MCSLETCPNRKCDLSPRDTTAYICNKLVQEIRKHLSKYYLGWLKCDDVVCGHRTRIPTARLRNGHPVCDACERGNLHPEYTDTQLYNQLLYYQYIFDVDKALEEVDQELRIAVKKYLQNFSSEYSQLKAVVDAYLSRNAYGRVDLNKLFSWM